MLGLKGSVISRVRLNGELMVTKMYKTKNGALKKYNKELNFYNRVHPEKRELWYMFEPRIHERNGYYFVTFKD